VHEYTWLPKQHHLVALVSATKNCFGVGGTYGSVKQYGSRRSWGLSLLTAYQPVTYWTHGSGWSVVHAGNAPACDREILHCGHAKDATVFNLIVAKSSLGWAVDLW